ncbi:MAG TPA: flagellar biosynthesis protein FlhB [Alphaproteobacteria bacterium]|nr:flagellar biosynthesis protein FlhB [Alphaproteobacteria bacterium]
MKALSGDLAAHLRGAGNDPLSAAAFRDLSWRIILEAGAFLAVPFALFIAVAIGAHLLQRPFVVSWTKVEPKWSKIGIMSGFHRLFGPQGLVMFAKGLVKVAAVATACWFVLWPRRNDLASLFDASLSAALSQTHAMVMLIAYCTLVIFGVIAVLDYVWQAFDRRQRLMMTRQEVRDEFKQAEGDPHVKARLRAIRSEKSRRRMMAAVPSASVVVTNPTHFSVALKYESGAMAAPVVVAKGVDSLALRIREIAKENNVPVVENPPLARSLYATVDIDEAVKPEHYKAVAHVIGYVMRLKGKLAARADGRRAN